MLFTPSLHSRQDNRGMSLERKIDFSRPRLLKCGKCAFVNEATFAWIHNWENDKVSCARCGVVFGRETSAEYTYRLEDPALDAGRISEVYWYHSTSQQVWPDPNYNPWAGISDQARARMNKQLGRERTKSWELKQRSRALHVGTYEAAIENMLRRMRNENDCGDFNLYRVRIAANAAIDYDIQTDPGGQMGNVQLREVGQEGS